MQTQTCESMELAGKEAIGMLGHLQTTLHKYDTSRRGPNIKHVVLWAGTNDVLQILCLPQRTSSKVS